MSGSVPLPTDLSKALLSAHHSAKDDNDFLTKVSLAFEGLFDFTEDFNRVVEQDQAESKEKTEMTLESLPLLPLETIASFLDFKSLVNTSFLAALAALYLPLLTE